MKCVDTNQCQTLCNRAFSVIICPSVPYHQSPIMGTNLDEKRNYFQTQMYNRIRVGFLQVDFMRVPLTAFANSSETITALEHDWKNQTFANGFVSYPLVNFMRKVVS